MFVRSSHSFKEFQNETKSLNYQRDVSTLTREIESIAQETDFITTETCKIKIHLKNRETAICTQVEPLLQDLKQPWEFYQTKGRCRVINDGIKKEHANHEKNPHAQLDGIVKRLNTILNSLLRHPQNQLLVESLEKILMIYKDFKERFNQASEDTKEILLHGRVQIRLHTGYRYLDQNKEENFRLCLQNSVMFRLGSIFWKINPDAPSIENALNHLYQLISGQTSCPNTMLKISSKDSSCYALASKNIPGDNLLEVLQQHPSSISKIDRANFSAMALLAMLTDPLQGNPDHFIVQKISQEEEEKLLLHRIHHDFSFSNVLSQEERQYQLEIKEILFLFPQMNLPLEESFRNYFLALSPEWITVEWLKSMEHQNEIYQDFLDREIITKGDYKKLHLPFTVFKTSSRLNHVTILYDRLRKLQNALQTTPESTLYQLLEKINSPLFNYYKLKYGHYLRNTPKETQNLLDAFHKFCQTGNNQTMTSLDNTSIYEKYYQNLPKTRHLPETCAQSPREALEDFLGHLRWDNISVKSQKRVFHSLETAPFLRTLRLNYCTYFDDSSLVALASHFPLLEKLILIGCPTISVNGLKPLLINNPRLELMIGSSPYNIQKI